MASQIFLNLPVKDLQKSIAFFSELGFSFNEQFTNEDSTCMIVGEHIFVMLLTEARFKGFIKKDVADAFKTTEVLIGINAASREEVDAIVSIAIEAGGSAPNDK